jgi:hypothetical protein
MLKDIIDKKKKSKEDYIERKKKGIWNFKKKPYLALLLNQTQQVNIKTSQPDFLSSPSLKLTRMRVDFT